MRPTKPPAAVSGDEHRTDDAAPRELVGRWAPDPDLGHELGGAFVLSPRHALAGVNVDAVTDSGAVGADGGRGTVLDVFASMDDRSRIWLFNCYGPSLRLARRVHCALRAAWAARCRRSRHNRAAAHLVVVESPGRQRARPLIGTASPTCAESMGRVPGPKPLIRWR
jgi:hypothetical protein